MLAVVFPQRFSLRILGISSCELSLQTRPRCYVVLLLDVFSSHKALALSAKPFIMMYVGETWRLFQTRKKEHMDKVRLTIEDLHKGNTLSAEKRMGKEHGGQARHTTE